MVFFPLYNCLTQTVFFTLAIILTWRNNKVSGGHCELFFKIGKPVTALSKNWSPAFLYLIYLSFTPNNFQFARSQIDAIGRDTVPHVATHVSDTFLMKCVSKSSTLIPIDSNSGWWFCTTSFNILLKSLYWWFPLKKFLWPVIIDGWAIMYRASANRVQITGSKEFAYTCNGWWIFLIPSWSVCVFAKVNRSASRWNDICYNFLPTQFYACAIRFHSRTRNVWSAICSIFLLRKIIPARYLYAW